MFCKRNDGVKGICTQTTSRRFQLTWNGTPPIPSDREAHIYKRSHGRILITDGVDICHTGAFAERSRQKKIFAFQNWNTCKTAVTDLP